MTSLLVLALLLSACAGTAQSETATGNVNSPVLSPDGKTLAISYSKDGACFIYTVVVDNGLATRLTSGKTGCVGTPAFSPDGKHLAYYAKEKEVDAHAHVEIMEIDGTNARTITASAEANDYFPIFSLDGMKIYFARSQFSGNYSPIARSAPHDWDIFSVGLDGRDLKQVTHERLYEMGRPSLSPDGKSLIVKSTTALGPEARESGERLAIYSLEEPAKATVLLQPQVGKEPTMLSRRDPHFEGPNYLQDGKAIVFMAASRGKSIFDYDIYRLDLTAGSPERLTTGNANASAFHASANGKTAVFLKNRLDSNNRSVGSDVNLLNLQTHVATLLQIKGLE